MRQLRLRDIGGIIVIDFIDMARARNRDQVLKTLRKALDADKTKTYVMEVSPLGLVEMTRQNVTDGVREILTKRCPTCEGEGVVESEETVAIERRPPACATWSTSSPSAGGVPGQGEPARSPPSSLREEQPAARARGGTGKHFHFEGGEALPLDTYEVVDRGTRAEIEERALPFQVGDEVLVSDRGAAHVQRRRRDRAGRLLHRQRHRRRRRFVGDRRLVRIESVGRLGGHRVAGREDEATATDADDAEARLAERRLRRIARLPDGAAADEAAGAVLAPRRRTASNGD